MRTHLFFDAFGLKHARVGKHECAEGVLAGADVTCVHHRQAVQLAQRLKAILDGTAPARATTQTRVRHAACHVRNYHIHCTCIKSRLLPCCAGQFLTLGLLRPQMCIVHLICYVHVHVPVFVAQRKAMQPSLRNSLKDYETKIRQGEESLHENRVMGNQDEVFFVYFLISITFLKKSTFYIVPSFTPLEYIN